MILSQVSSRTRGSQCSCEECDSAECFSKRYLNQLCSCELCSYSETCLYPQKLTISVPNQVDLPTLLGKTEAAIVKLNQSKTTDDFTNAEPCHLSAGTEPLKKVISKLSNTAKSPRSSKIPICIDKGFSKSHSTKAAKKSRKILTRSSSRAKTKVNQKDSNVHQKVIKKEIICVYDRNNSLQTVTTKESKVSIRNIQPETYAQEHLNYPDEESIVNSIDTYSEKDMEFARSTARLAAQIMNMPYTDYQSSLPESKSSILEQVAKYPIDIFKRIKEAYKACSCKVCECIGGKSITSGDICNCKPCDCDECKHLTVNVLGFSNVLPVNNDGCACNRCDRKNCKGITGNRVCDCQIREYETNCEKYCDCEPCQCMECTLRRGRQKNVVVARVVENYVNSMCDCTPCECSDCLRSYGISNEREATTRHEMSTGVDRHPGCQCEACISEACVPDGNESCWCVRHSKVMSKPFQRDTDYDIRRANVPLCFEPKYKNKNDALAMYASITNTYPQKRKICLCDPCECLVCNYKDNRGSRNVVKDENVNYGENSAQKQLYSIEEQMAEHSIKIKNINCGYGFCDCENCQTRKTTRDIQDKSKSSKKICTSATCICNRCECLNVENQNIENRKLFYGFQRYLNDNELQTQSISKPYSTLLNTNDPYLEKYGVVNYNENVFTKNASINHISTKDRENINFYENYPTIRNCCQRNIKPAQYVSSRIDELKQISGVCNSTNKEKTDYNNNLKNSGYDYADYLVNFQKTTVQKRIDELTKSNFMNAEYIKVNYMNKTPPVISTSYKNDVKYKYMPIPPSLMQQNSETPRPTNDNCRVTPLSVLSNHASLCSKSSLHRMSEVIAIQTTSNKEERRNIECDRKTNPQKLTIQNNSSVLKQLMEPVNDKQLTKIKKHVTVNPMHDDLEEVQNTLTEAREFSKQLLQLLEKYEDANEKFDSVSKKFEMFDCPPTCELKPQTEKQHSRIKFQKDAEVGSTQSSESQNDIRLKESPLTTSIKCRHNKNQTKSSSKLLLENSQSKSSNSFRNDEENKSKKAAISKEIMLSKENKVGLNFFSNNDASVITEPAYIFKTKTDDDNWLKPTKSSHVTVFLNAIVEEKVSEILSDVYKAKSEKKDKELKKKINFNYLYKRTMSMSKKMNTMPRHENVKLKANVTEQSETIAYEADIKRNAKYSFKNNDLTNNVSKDKNSIHNLQDAVTNLQVARKNFQHETKSNVDLGHVNNTFSNLDLKAALQSIPLEPEVVTTKVKTVCHHENQALINLKSEVDKLLEMPLLQHFMDKINDICNSKHTRKKLQVKETSETKYTACSKTYIAEKDEVREDSFSFYRKPLPNNKYNSLKVSYVNVRQVSDDSVIVKWDAPQNINNVEGYEVLIDGKTVHRILNPNKCNAFVSGLPNGDNEKILLSIRTVTNIPNMKRMPVTTIIFRPQPTVY